MFQELSIDFKSLAADMDPAASTEDVYEERVARFVELAEAAQRAAETAVQQARPNLQETYNTMAKHWLTL